MLTIQLANTVGDKIMQLNLLDYTPPITIAPHRGVDTSVEVAKKIGPSIKEKQHRAIYSLSNKGP